MANDQKMYNLITKSSAKLLENLPLQSTIPVEFESFLWNRFRRNKQILKGSFTLVLSLIILKTVIFKLHCTVLFQPLFNTDRHSGSVRKAYLYNKLSLWRQILLDRPCPTTSVEHLRSVHCKIHRIKDRLTTTFFTSVDLYPQTTKTMNRGYKHCFNMQRRFA